MARKKVVEDMSIIDPEIQAVEYKGAEVKEATPKDVDNFIKKATEGVKARSYEIVSILQPQSISDYQRAIGQATTLGLFRSPKTAFSNITHPFITWNGEFIEVYAKISKNPQFTNVNQFFEFIQSGEKEIIIDLRGTISFQNMEIPTKDVKRIILRKGDQHIQTFEL